MTPKQEEALRGYLQEAIVPLIEQVLVKKLGQAMTFAAQEVVSPQRKPLTTQEIRKWWASENGLEDCVMSKLDDFEQVVRAIEAAHGIKGDA